MRRGMRKNPQTRFPHARKLMLTTCYGFRIQNGLLRLPVGPRHYIYVKLNNHTLQVLSGLNARSITLTPDTLGISYAKETVEIKPEGYVGVDRNLDNVTVASTDGTVKAFDLSKATRIKAYYRLCQEPFQAKRRANKNRRLLQVWRKAEEPSTANTP